jgi:hypothetical protein
MASAFYGSSQCVLAGISGSGTGKLTFVFGSGTSTLPVILVNNYYRNSEVVFDPVTNSPNITCTGLTLEMQEAITASKVTMDISGGTPNLTINGNILVYCRLVANGGYARIYVGSGSPSLSCTGTMTFRCDNYSSYINNARWEATTGSPTLTCAGLYLQNDSSQSGSVVLFDCGSGTPTINVNGDLQFTGTGSQPEQINATGTWTISKSTTHTVSLGGGTFNKGTSTFIFAGVGTVTVDSAVSWYNFTYGASKTHKFQAAVLQEITHTLATNSTSGTRALLRSISNGTRWKLSAPAGLQLGNKMDIQDGDASTYNLVKAWGSIGAAQNNLNIQFAPGGGESLYFMSGAV